MMAIILSLIVACVITLAVYAYIRAHDRNAPVAQAREYSLKVFVLTFSLTYVAAVIFGDKKKLSPLQHAYTCEPGF